MRSAESVIIWLTAGFIILSAAAITAAVIAERTMIYSKILWALLFDNITIHLL
jgi:hypothetical protein